MEARKENKKKIKDRTKERSTKRQTERKKEIKNMKQIYKKHQTKTFQSVPVNDSRHKRTPTFN